MKRKILIFAICYWLFLLTLFTSITANANNADYNNAQSTALEAVYIQSGLSEYVDAYAKYLDIKYMPDEYRAEGAAALFLLQCISTQKVGYKWTF